MFRPQLLLQTQRVFLKVKHSPRLDAPLSNAKGKAPPAPHSVSEILETYRVVSPRKM